MKQDMGKRFILMGEELFRTLHLEQYDISVDVYMKKFS